MKTAVLIGLLLFCLPGFSWAAASGDSLLAAHLDSLVEHRLPKGSDVGLSVYDLTANRMLYEYQATRNLPMRIWIRWWLLWHVLLSLW